MKRRTFMAAVSDDSGESIAVKRTSAWNSAIRATEAILREHGRTTVGVLEGAKPEVVEEDGERAYRRLWTTAAGREFRALVWEIR